MREAESGWYYVGHGQLRYKDGHGWTDRYQDLDKDGGHPPRHSAPVGPDDDGQPAAKGSPRGRIPRRHATIRVVVLTGLIGLAVTGGVLKPDVPQGWVSWATVKAGQVFR